MPVRKKPAVPRTLVLKTKALGPPVKRKPGRKKKNGWSCERNTSVKSISLWDEDWQWVDVRAALLGIGRSEYISRLVKNRRLQVQEEQQAQERIENAEERSG